MSEPGQQDELEVLEQPAGPDEAPVAARTDSEVEVEPTGNPRVDQALDRLAEIDSLPTSEHAEVYEDVHRRLHAALTELDDD